MGKGLNANDDEDMERCLHRHNDDENN